jgi:hypothetical protein
MLIRILESAEDVTPEVLTAAEDVYDDYYSETERIDWDEFIDRFVIYVEGTWDIENYDSPAARAIQSHIRRLRASEGR